MQVIKNPMGNGIELQKSDGQENVPDEHFLVNWLHGRHSWVKRRMAGTKRTRQIKNPGTARKLANTIRRVKHEGGSIVLWRCFSAAVLLHPIAPWSRFSKEPLVSMVTQGSPFSTTRTQSTHDLEWSHQTTERPSEHPWDLKMADNRDSPCQDPPGGTREPGQIPSGS